MSSTHSPFSSTPNSLPTSPPLNIPVILGASRPGRRSEHVAKYILGQLQAQPGITTTLVDVRDFPIEYDDARSIPAFHAIAQAADAFVLVFPEYNQGFPGKLKSLLDTELAVYHHKPVALASVSNGQFGGARAAALLTPVLTKLGMVVTGLNLHFPFVQNSFDEAGALTDSKVPERVDRMLSELISFTQTLKKGQAAASLSSTRP